MLDVRLSIKRPPLNEVVAFRPKASRFHQSTFFSEIESTEPEALADAEIDSPLAAPLSVAYLTYVPGAMIPGENELTVAPAFVNLTVRRGAITLVTTMVTA